MDKIKLTKNEHKKQKDDLKRFERYLPTLFLKKQQIQAEIRGVENRADELAARREEITANFADWIGVFVDEGVFSPDILRIKQLMTTIDNIAGVDVPVFVDIEFEVAEYDLDEKPLWLDYAIEYMKAEIMLEMELKWVREQERLLRNELRVTTQRVNLFEKVKIPEAKANIKKIAVYLGDQQAAAVVRGKIAKRGMENTG
ncbi:MAG: V-type ATP synthase subunit D [Lachnospiraceae bacterium]|jgi:V/A-type H+-transporting ATPase subunit D|nr:V-type ATP synthase subunit D [Lachnospiraceae bacterium]